MFVAFVLYGSLNALSGMFTGTIDGLEADNIIVMPRYDFIAGKLPLSHVNYIETLDGIESIIYADYLLSDSMAGMMDGRRQTGRLLPPPCGDGSIAAPIRRQAASPIACGTSTTIYCTDVPLTERLGGRRRPC